MLSHQPLANFHFDSKKGDLYLCFWGDGYDEPGLQIHRLEDFTEDTGYSPEDIKKITNLKRNQIWNSDQPEQHFVVKICGDF